MAAYGALLSLTNTIHQIQNHPRPPISLDKLKIKPLTEKVDFLLHFLENYIIDNADVLEGRMLDASREAEDIIESHIADHFENEDEDSLCRYIQKMMVESDASHEAGDLIESHTAHHTEAPGEANISSNDDSLYRELQKVIHDLDFIAKDVAAIKEKVGEKNAPSDDVVVGSDNVMNSVMDKLNNSRYSERGDSLMNDIIYKLIGRHSSRWLIAIAGMSGIGKTTLAKRIYEHPHIVKHFHVRGWATVSQEFDSKMILLQLLDCLKNKGTGDIEYEELGQKLGKSLYGRQYLIVMDDIWGTDVWDSVKRFIPEISGGSKVLITTRSSTVALQLDGPDYFQMEKLDKSRYSEGDNSDINYIMDRLSNEQSSHLIIAIAGMGGIGKTTLAKRIYEHPLIVEQFYIRGWATVSQEFDSKRILLQVLDCLKNKGREDSIYEELGQNLYQSLYGQRYLIVMDDIWGTDAWDKVKRFFPVNNNGSKVLITTRPSNLALQLDGPDYYQMPFMKVGESWNLLRRCVFQEQGCPLELEDIGKDIAKNCRGLPLSIVVIGGLLAKSEHTQEKWLHVLENLRSIVNLEDDQSCFKILKLSYNQLPVHLKPCFLYMGMFPEDRRIHVPTLLKLWVDEGFVKPVAGKRLKTVAREVYLHDLVLRNLILVHKWGPTGRIKRCGIHDLLRDLCIKEAEKYNFFRTMETTPTHNNPEHHDQISWRAQRRIGIHQAGKYIPRPLPEAVQSASRAKTLIWNVDGNLPSVVPFRLLRILNGYDKSYYHLHEYSEQELFLPPNLCHLVAPMTQFPVEVLYRLWNLRTLIVALVWNRRPVLDIWRMPQLRHIKVQSLQLTDPPPPIPMDEENGWMVLENLETLQTVWNMKLGEKVVERIPNIKKLELRYDEEEEEEEEEELTLADYSLDNLCRLHKLEALSLSCSASIYRRIEVTFPNSLRKLKLEDTTLGWEKMGTKIGTLPYLEELELDHNAFVGPEWETIDDGFPSLKCLNIQGCDDLEQWRAEANHFPSLERLELGFLRKLKEIPLEIGDINTLREIKVYRCADSAVLSVRKIIEEQIECLGEVSFRFQWYI